MKKINMKSLIITSIVCLLPIFCCIVSDLSDKNPEANKKAVTVYKWIIPIITVVLYKETT